jgi:hypothetical protein
MWPARVVAGVCLVLGLLAAGVAFAQFNKCGRGFCPGGAFGSGFPAPGGSITPPVGGNNILLVDGASFLLQTDGASKVCLAGGC